METRIIDDKKFSPVSRGPRSSRYDTTVDDLIKLPVGKVIEIAFVKGQDLGVARARIQTAIRTVLRKRKTELHFSCQVSTSGTIGIKRLTVPKKKPVVRKRGKKKKGGR